MNKCESCVRNKVFVQECHEVERRMTCIVCVVREGVLGVYTVLVQYKPVECTVQPRSIRVH